MNTLGHIQKLRVNLFKSTMSNLNFKKNNVLVENFIVFLLFIIFVVFRSIKTLSMIFSYGVFKKEVLTTKSNLGFDMKIKIK